MHFAKEDSPRASVQTHIYEEHRQLGWLAADLHVGVVPGGDDRIRAAHSLASGICVELQTLSAIRDLRQKLEERIWIA